MANHRDPTPEWLNLQYVQTFLRTSLDDPDLTIQSVEIEPGSAVGDNYACQIFRIKLNLESNKITENQLSIIGKLKPETIVLQEMNLDMFGIEARYFTYLQPKIIEVIKKSRTANVFFPRCYYVDNEREIIFMEDLKYEQKLELQPRGKFLTLQQLELVIDALATMHATSVHVVKEHPEVVDLFNKHVWCEDAPPAIVKYISNASRAFEKHIESYNISSEWKNNLVGIRERLEADKWFKIYERKDGRLNVLAHGDIWLNNMMFKFTTKGAEKITLIDYQLVNYTSFANDLHYLLFTSAEPDVILNNTKQLLKRYYEKFTEIAPDVPDLNFERIESEFAEKYYFGYLMMLFVRPLVVAAVPPDLELIMKGNDEDVAYNHPQFISDIEKLLPLFEKLGVH